MIIQLLFCLSGSTTCIINIKDKSKKHFLDVNGNDMTLLIDN